MANISGGMAVFCISNTNLWKIFLCILNPSLRIDGNRAGIKGQEQTTIIVTKELATLLQKYQDCKRIQFGKLDPDGFFFVGKTGEMLSKMQRRRGSLLQEFADITGVKDFTINSLRKGFEGFIQSNDKLAEHTKALNNHSAAVLGAYDNMRSARRICTTFTLDQTKGKKHVDKEDSDEGEELDEELAVKRQKIEAEELKALKEKAVNVLKKKKRTKVDLSIPKEDKQFLSSLIDSDSLTGNIYHISY